MYYYKWHEVTWLKLRITTNGMRLDGYSYDCKWHEIRWLQLLLQMARGYMVTVILMNDMRLDS
jgi:hypothetical protein